ncbi:MAG: CoA transferase subunit A [Synergistaceae bacterium]|jgi:3-oxoacid CoA-transferase A subunit|nr:CoA transferase subunit A [Synergistaceae bacterium]
MTEERIQKLKSIDEALSMIKTGDRVMVSGFGNAGDPKQLVAALTQLSVKDLTIISNDLGSPGVGLGALLRAGMVKNLIGNYYNWNPEVADAYNSGKIGVQLVPQGSFAEGIRAAGVGIPAFYTPTAVGTELAKGEEERVFAGKKYILQEAIKADVALISAAKADTLGNLVYYKTARNFNPLMAMAADFVIAEVGEIVPAGAFDPESVATPHIFIDVLVQRR